MFLAPHIRRAARFFLGLGLVTGSASALASESPSEPNSFACVLSANRARLRVSYRMEGCFRDWERVLVLERDGARTWLQRSQEDGVGEPLASPVPLARAEWERRVRELAAAVTRPEASPVCGSTTRRITSFVWTCEPTEGAQVKNQLSFESYDDRCLVADPSSEWMFRVDDRGYSRTLGVADVVDSISEAYPSR